jgi:hypothetical protein
MTDQTDRELPRNYWGRAMHYYARDHDCMAWSVRKGDENFVPIATGLDKSVAAALACLLNGDIAFARWFLEGLPDTMPDGH